MCGSQWGKQQKMHSAVSQLIFPHKNWGHPWHRNFHSKLTSITDWMLKLYCLMKGMHPPIPPAICGASSATQIYLLWKSNPQNCNPTYKHIPRVLKIIVTEYLTTCKCSTGATVYSSFPDKEMREARQQGKVFQVCFLLIPAGYSCLYRHKTCYLA